MSSTEPSSSAGAAGAVPSAITTASSSGAATGATTTTTTTGSKPKRPSTSKKKVTAVKASGGAKTQAKARKPGSTSSSAARKKTASGSGGTTSGAGGGASSSANNKGGGGGGSGGGGGTSATSASNQALVNDARAAQLDLARQKALAAARRSDPLWYRIEEVLPALGFMGGITDAGGTSTIGGGGTGVGSLPNTLLPEQVQIVETALSHHGLTRADVTPQAMACLLEQARRYAQELISNAQDYAYSASRAELTRADLALAAEMRADYHVDVSTQLPKLYLVSQKINRAPLPPIPAHCYSGVLLPPKQHQLTARTFDVISAAQMSARMVQKVPEAPTTTTTNTTATTTSSNKKKTTTTSGGGGGGGGQPSYGAARGRQIPVKLKESSSSAQSKQQPQPAADSQKPEQALGDAMMTDASATAGGHSAQE